MAHQLVMSFSWLNLLVAQLFKHIILLSLKNDNKSNKIFLNYIENTFGNDQLFLSDKV